MKLPDMPKGWPPRDWRALAALLFSVGGAIATTVLVYLLCSMLLPKEGWGGATEPERVSTIRWAVLIGSACILLVLVGLGMAINRRKLSGKIGENSFDWEGGDEASAAAAKTAQAAVDEANLIADGAKSGGSDV